MLRVLTELLCCTIFECFLCFVGVVVEVRFLITTVKGVDTFMIGEIISLPPIRGLSVIPAGVATITPTSKSSRQTRSVCRLKDKIKIEYAIELFSNK